MKSQLNIYNMSKDKFYDIFEAITDSFSESEYVQYIMSSESNQEIYDFLQLIHPGSYSLDDLENFLKIILVELYKNSKEYTCNQIFKYTIWDIYKHYGENYLKLLVELDQAENRSSNVIHDSSLSVAGGVGGSYGRRFERILASGLAVAVPLTSLGAGTTMASESRLRKVEATSIVPTKKNKILDFFDRHKWLKYTMMGFVVIAAATGIYKGLTYITEQQKLKKAMKSQGIEQIKKDGKEKKAGEGLNLKDNYLVASAASKKIEEIKTSTESIGEKLKKLNSLGLHAKLMDEYNDADMKNGIQDDDLGKILKGPDINDKINLNADNVTTKIDKYIIVDEKLFLAWGRSLSPKSRI